jgi:hypothetical protein
MAKRRIVLLAADGSVEALLSLVEPGEEFSALRAAADDHPGRSVAAEWCATASGQPDWRRVLTRIPVSPV